MVYNLTGKKLSHPVPTLFYFQVLGSFPNFKNGTNILQQALTQFVQYYHSFHKVMATAELSNCAQQYPLINVHQLIVEVKKYKPSF